MKHVDSKCFALLAMSIAASLTMASCAPLATREARASKSSLGCMRAALHGRDFGDAPDAETHCIAAGLIARRCSVTESLLAGIGKEIQDMLGAGDAEWRDLSADRRGIRCAKSSEDEAHLARCCRASRIGRLTFPTRSALPTAM